MNADDPSEHLPLTNLAFHILLALGDRPRHGYAIIQDIEERTDRTVRVRSGTLYTAIQRLESEGLLSESRWRPEADRDDERRKYYEITPLGRATAHLESARLAQMVGTARKRNLFDAEVS